MQGKLATEIETYRKELPNLLATSQGKYVLIQDSTVLSAWDTYEDAIQEGYKTFGVAKPFLVKKIEASEYVHFNSRAVVPACHQ